MLGLRHCLYLIFHCACNAIIFFLLFRGLNKQGFKCQGKFLFTLCYYIMITSMSISVVDVWCLKNLALHCINESLILWLLTAFTSEFNIVQRGFAVTSKNVSWALMIERCLINIWNQTKSEADFKKCNLKHKSHYSHIHIHIIEQTI